MRLSRWRTAKRGVRGGRLQLILEQLAGVCDRFWLITCPLIPRLETFALVGDEFRVVDRFGAVHAKSNFGGRPHSKHSK